jgi:DNA invertase Pin-like site-specific DNA recombinase
MTQQKRCAIYTRKSTEEGLDMAFNSLDAQREACEAYIKSQRSEGWLLLPTAYDDGGFSGGSMARPGLKRLMADVEAGKVDVIVVYKVDRLTRALSDFAKIVDVLDAAGASFVSVTQAFNTTTSMGRLTLNVLLSFAQFEREVGAERIRDKIAQSKARGIWMGGPLPLGYETKERKLVPIPAEVKTLRHIFELYLELPSVRALKERLDAEGIVTKVKNGKMGTSGGVPFGRGGLYHLLSNPVVIGKIRHKDKLYDGEHPAIIPLPLWKAVQARLAAHGVDRRAKNGTTRSALLTGLVHDHVGRPMSPTHSQKGAKRYHYYASSTAKEISDGIAEADSEQVIRVGQMAADQAIHFAIMRLFERDAVLNLLDPLDLDLSAIEAALAVANEASHRTGTKGGMPLRHLLQKFNFTMVMAPDRVTASIDKRCLVAMLLGQTPDTEQETYPLLLDVPLELKRKGNATRLVLAGHVRKSPDPDPKLVRLLVNAERERRAMFTPGAPKPNAHQVKLARLAYLAPDITATILEGRQPARITSRLLLRLADMPMEWREQRRMLGLRRRVSASHRRSRHTI